jgi:hypothetical protein
MIYLLRIYCSEKGGMAVGGGRWAAKQSETGKAKSEPKRLPQIKAP